MSFVVRAAAVAACLAAAGCATQSQTHVEQLRRDTARPAVLVMPLDVELMEMNLGGVHEPKTEWTETARVLMMEELRGYAHGLGFRLLEHPRDFRGSPAEEEVAEQIARLHAVVGRSIRMHRRLMHLPSLGDDPRWSLGPEVRVLRERTGADYALFVFVRDSYANDARKVAMVAGLAMGAVLMPGLQEGFASLVDLQTGDIVWHNELGRATGDLRAREPAAETVKVLLTGFPK